VSDFSATVLGYSPNQQEKCDILRFDCDPDDLYMHHKTKNLKAEI
jgi:hypothetical protein